MPDKKPKSKHSVENAKEEKVAETHVKEHTELEPPAPEEEVKDDAEEFGSARPQFQVVEETESAPERERSEEPLENDDASALTPQAHRASASNPYPEADLTAADSMSDPNPNQSAQHDFRFNREPQRKFPWWIVVIVLVLALIGVGAWRFFFAAPQEPENAPSVTDILVEPPADTTPSPSPEATQPKREDLKVQVLNGSGIAGEAGKVAAVLETAGFEDIDTTNADNYDYTGITIQVKEGQNEIGRLVESDLEDDYEDIEIEDTLDADSEFDAVVIRGSQPGDEDILGAQDEETTEPTEDEEATESGTNE